MIRDNMIGYYAARAKEYERIYHKAERQDDLQRLRTLVETSFTDADVFEVACGTGYWTEVLARSAASVMATDINEELLAIARGKPIDRQKVEFRREDAYALPTLPRSFTGGFSGFWWSHIPRAMIRDFLRGFHRLFSPGSRIVFIDNVYVEGSSTPILRADEQGNTYQIRHLQNGSRYEVLKNFPTEMELRAGLDGLARDVSVEFLRYYWTLTYVPL
jgi:ubiquinone/menaquinone biosynthesis C-methylase UbiE